MAHRSIFRQAALERLSSPEQLDRLMQVTNPRGWMALAGLALVVGFALVWGVFGNLPTTITGTGILVSEAGMRVVEVSGPGMVTEVRVEVGDLVSEGDTIVLVGQPELRQRVDQARARVRVLEGERAKRQGSSATDASLEGESVERARLDLERRIEAAGERTSRLEDRVDAEREALDLGLVTRPTMRSTLQELEAARAARTGLELELQNNELQRELVAGRASGTVREVDARIRSAEAELAALQVELEGSATVLSPYSGYVREVHADVGQLVAAGQSLASIEMAGAPLQALVFVPTERTRIRPGMEARVSPATVLREEYGYIRGEVSFVSARPATPQGMQRTLGDEALAQQLAGMGAPFLVRVDLRRSTETPSGFLWSSRVGPPTPVESGTPVTVEVVVDRQRPIGLVIPAFRSAPVMP
jgi:HlyD family secretion protein